MRVNSNVGRLIDGEWSTGVVVQNHLIQHLCSVRSAEKTNSLSSANIRLCLELVLAIVHVLLQCAGCSGCQHYHWSQCRPKSRQCHCPRRRERRAWSPSCQRHWPDVSGGESEPRSAGVGSSGDGGVFFKAEAVHW